MANCGENLPHKHFDCHYRYSSEMPSAEQETYFVLFRDYIFSILSVFLAPFYCIGLLLKVILSIAIKLIKLSFKMLLCRNVVSDSDVSQGITIPAVPPPHENEYTVQKNILQEQPIHSKLVLCPKCEHLHYSSECCNCKECVMRKPRLLKCLKYHKTDAQLLMCPCIDCKYQRPMPEVCQHCVLVSQKLHIQAKTPADIEIRTRPKRKK